MTNAFSKFEIRVLVVGNVSAGKSTVINALLQGKFTEMAKRRTTACVNFFRLLSLSDPNFAMTLNEPRSPESAMEEIKEDNIFGREFDSVREKHFDVLVHELPCDTRSDTVLVYVETPGLNEAESDSKFAAYVNENWSKFDMVVVVMDGTHGVNSTDQVAVLDMVKKNNDEQRELPIIVVCNKVDDNDDDETMELVGEVQQKVQEIFGVGDRGVALNEMLMGDQQATTGTTGSFSPVFLHMSAFKAFLYRGAESFTLGGFGTLDEKLVDEIGKEEFGKQWKKRFSVEEKCKKLREVVTDPKEFKDRLEGTNFATFMDVLSFFMGGIQTQQRLLQKQLVHSLKTVTANDVFAGELDGMYDKCKKVGHTVNDVQDAFWRVYEPYKARAVESFQSTMSVDTLDKPIKLLGEFKRISERAGWGDEIARATKAMEGIVADQVRVFAEEDAKWKFDTFARARLDGNGSGESMWQLLSPHDWTCILGSFLNAGDAVFNERFGREAIMLGTMLQKYANYGDEKVKLEPEHVQYRDIMNEYLKRSYVDGIFVPDDVTKYEKVAMIDIPKEFRDVNHWGHVVWSFCRFASS